MKNVPQSMILPLPKGFLGPQIEFAAMFIDDEVRNATKGAEELRVYLAL